MTTVPNFHPLTSQVDPSRLRATVEKLASWPNRNTNNPTLTEAAEWIASRFREIPGLEVELMKYRIEPSPRVPEAKEVVEVVATLPGKTDRRVIIGGHFDSINMTDQKDLSLRAPGANDDASGVALTLESARILATRKWNQTLTFVAFSGEEQGLLGSAALAKRAREEGWKIDAVLSNDMVGNSRNLHGQADDREVRVFSEESPSHNSRELARFIEWLNRTSGNRHGVKLVFRADRFGRGGDHSSFNHEGFTAVRFVEVDEEYSRQHTPNDLPEFVDFDYLANNTRIDIQTAASLADAPEPPTRVRADRAQSHDALITWEGDPNAKYVVYWRATTSPVWQEWREVTGTRAVFPKVSKDDNVFAVGAPGGIPIEAK